MNSKRDLKNADLFQEDTILMSYYKNKRNDVISEIFCWLAREQVFLPETGTKLLRMWLDMYPRKSKRKYEQYLLSRNPNFYESDDDVDDIEKMTTSEYFFMKGNTKFEVPKMENIILRTVTLESTKKSESDITRSDYFYFHQDKMVTVLNKEKNRAFNVHIAEQNEPCAQTGIELLEDKTKDLTEDLNLGNTDYQLCKLDVEKCGLTNVLSFDKTFLTRQELNEGLDDPLPEIQPFAEYYSVISNESTVRDLQGEEKNKKYRTKLFRGSKDEKKKRIQLSVDTACNKNLRESQLLKPQINKMSLLNIQSNTKENPRNNETSKQEVTYTQNNLVPKILTMGNRTEKKDFTNINEVCVKTVLTHEGNTQYFSGGLRNALTNRFLPELYPNSEEIIRAVPMDAFILQTKLTKDCIRISDAQLGFFDTMQWRERVKEKNETMSPTIPYIPQNNSSKNKGPALIKLNRTFMKLCEMSDSSSSSLVSLESEQPGGTGNIKITEEQLFMSEEKGVGINPDETQTKIKNSALTKIPPWGRYPYNKIIYHDFRLQRQLGKFLMSIKEKNWPIINFNLYIESGGIYNIPDFQYRPMKSKSCISEVLNVSKVDKNLALNREVSFIDEFEPSKDWTQYYNTRVLTEYENGYIYLQNHLLMRKCEKIKKIFRARIE